MLGDNQFAVDGVSSIFRDRARAYIPLFREDEMPFNSLGGYKKSKQFNYTGVTVGKVPKGSGIYIDNVFVSRFDRNIPKDMKNMNSEILDWSIEKNDLIFFIWLNHSSSSLISICLLFLVKLSSCNL